MKLSSDHAKQSQGKQFESIALAHLKQQGLDLLAENFHCKMGEIDLIMLDHKQVVFIEVRSRSASQFGSALESITKSKQQRIRRTASYWLQQNPIYQRSICRFDCIGIDLKPSENIQTSNDCDLNWIKNAFY